ncbi:translation initiation factor eIF-2B subunit alpha [Cladophialophora chaetospira]|uniref:Translation initiation factor eIF2B subunit alpha n=1 Tax=Cladophialophora chaetospira TaxID=386627 RepID=A0AA38WXC2_9EURO|nr:translation initiation factor eIF-2B subunit alpha [Cladophialophora chaetospira]
MARGSLSTPPRTPKPVDSPPTEFDIVAAYNESIQNDPNITPPIAAIESLIDLLASSPLSTISETLALLSAHSQKLLASQRNPIPLSAGTELFQRYLISSFQQRPSSLANSDFSTLRHHIITQSSVFVKRANGARKTIARHALPFIKDDSTIITFGFSRVVQSILALAAEENRSFNVIYILPASSSSPKGSLETSISKLQRLDIPTSTIPLHALPYALSSLSTSPQFLLGATAVLENGSIVTDQGTHTIALIAKAFNIPLHVCVESYKFVRNFPLGYGPSALARLGVSQDVLRFSTPGDDGASEAGEANDAGVQEKKGDDYFGSEAKKTEEEEESKGPGIEITPPDLISALITENGIMTPNAVSEELIKLWF